MKQVRLNVCSDRCICLPTKTQRRHPHPPPQKKPEWCINCWSSFSLGALSHLEVELLDVRPALCERGINAVAAPHSLDLTSPRTV